MVSMALPQWLRQMSWKVQRHLDPRAALADLFEQYGETLYRYAASLTGRAAAAEDAVQEVFVQLAADLSRLKTIHDPRPYLFRAVRNQVFKYEQRCSSHWEEIPEDLMVGPQPLEERQALLQALQTLPSEQREVVLLKQVMELSFKEISELLEISLNTAASRYRYAIDKLRHQLNPTQEDVHHVV